MYFLFCYQGDIALLWWQEVFCKATCARAWVPQFESDALTGWEWGKILDIFSALVFSKLVISLNPRCKLTQLKKPENVL